MKFKNTLQKGSIRYIVFREGSTWYAVGLEFNIVESGDDPREVLFSLFEAIQGYVKSARKINARPHILNQKTDEEYEELWDRIKESQRSSQQIRNPLVYTHGEAALVAA